MMNPFFRRLALLTGDNAIEALEKSRVIVFGLGGVGSWCAEALVRSGLGNISLVDADTIRESNINRQVQAAAGNIGRLKAEALAERLLEINPACRVSSFPSFFSGETAGLFDIPGTDYVIDAIDTLACKLDLIETAAASGKRLFSSMGMGQKLDPTLIKTADIWDTSGCPLARLVRQGLKKRNFTGHFTAVYSPERRPGPAVEEAPKKPIGSAVMVTAAAGMALASLVLRDLVSRE